MNQIDSLDDAIAFGMTFKAAENTRDFFEKNDSVREHIFLSYYDICEIYQVVSNMIFLSIFSVGISIFAKELHRV